MTGPLVSVVVIGRNEGVRLSRCLTSVAAMDCRGFTAETIYVDSGSTDQSVAVATSAGARTVVVGSARPTAAAGRNAGWAAAAGEFVLFLDGDTEVEAGFVADTLCVFDDPGVGVAWGHRRETLATRSVYNRVLDLDWIYSPGETAFCGGDALVRRSMLEATGGFDGSLIAGEEPELCRRIRARGARILHVDRAMTGHDLGITRFRQYWKRATRAGHAFAEVSAKFAESSDPMWLADSRANRRKAALLTGVACGGVVSGLFWRSVTPVGAAVGVLLLLVARTAWRSRWKSTDWGTLLLYGVHSHFQQIPILAGQIMFWLNRRRGRRAELLDYKPQ